MSKKYKEGILPFKVVATDDFLIARGSLILPYEFAMTIKLTQAIDNELPPPGSGQLPGNGYARDRLERPRGRLPAFLPQVGEIAGNPVARSRGRRLRPVLRGPTTRHPPRHRPNTRIPSQNSVSIAGVVPKRLPRTASTKRNTVAPRPEGLRSYCVVHPPSIGIAVPVTLWASSEHSHRASAPCSILMQ